MAKKPSKELTELAERALRAKIKADALADEAKKLQEELYEKADKEGFVDPDTKAIGDKVRTVFSPNRFFDQQKATDKFGVNSKIIKQATVKKIDGAILKQLVTPADYEECMEFHPKKYKLGLRVND